MRTNANEPFYRAALALRQQAGLVLAEYLRQERCGQRDKDALAWHLQRVQVNLYRLINLLDKD